jgi:hypothetical protein
MIVAIASGRSSGGPSQNCATRRPVSRAEAQPLTEPRQHAVHHPVARDQEHPYRVAGREGRPKQRVGRGHQRRVEGRHVRGGARRQAVGVGERPLLVEGHRHRRHLEARVRADPPLGDPGEGEALHPEVEEEDEGEGTPGRGHERDPLHCAPARQARCRLGRPRSSARSRWAAARSPWNPRASTASWRRGAGGPALPGAA